MIQFTAYIKGQPQGSSSAHVIAGRAHIFSANKKLKPFREQVKQAAILAVVQHRDTVPWDAEPFFGKHVPVKIALTFAFVKPASVKNRPLHVVKPDIDKLARGLLDSLTGVVFADDAQVCEMFVRKVYGPVESVEVTAEAI